MGVAVSKPSAAALSKVSKPNVDCTVIKKKIPSVSRPTASRRGVTAESCQVFLGQSKPTLSKWTKSTKNFALFLKCLKCKAKRQCPIEKTLNASQDFKKLSFEKSARGLDRESLTGLTL